MSSLFQRLKSVPPDRIVLWGDTPARFSDLGRLSSALDARIRGQGVILQAPSLSKALPLLVAVDGIASDLMLVARGMELDEAVELGKTARCTLVVSETRPSAASGCDWLPVDELLSEISRRAADPAERADGDELATAWLLATSGTTGRPKLVQHTLASLTRTTKTDCERGAGVRWGMVYDHARFAGLQVLLQSVLSGGTLIAPSSDWSLEQQVHHLARGRCTHLSATPTLWRKLLMTEAARELDLRQVTLGGEIADQRLLDALRGNFPEARISHIYASTEAGVGFSVTDGREGFPADYLSTPPAGIELRVVDGRLYVRNTEVHAQYVNTGESFTDNDGFVMTGDLIEVTPDRCLFLGREKGIINVGGNKVHPEQVERVLLQHPDVRETRVYARRNPITGALVAADIVLADSHADAAHARGQILAWCRERLERYQMPASLRFVEELKFNVSGKLARDAA